MEFNKDSRFDIRLKQGEDAEGRFARTLLAGKQECKIEVKSEPKCEQTERVAVEFKQGHQGKPSGIHPSATESDVWAIEYAPECFISMPTSKLREIARRQWEIEKRMNPSYEGTPMGDNNNVGVLVPLTSLIDPFMLAPSERREEYGA